MRRQRVVVMSLLLAALAVLPAFAYTDCYSYTYTVCDPIECCTSRCYECDFYAADGTPEGYVLQCTDEGCLPRGN